MSELEQEVEAVQPDEGQGQPVAEGSVVQPEGQGQQDAHDGLYDLSSIEDPSIRSEVERIAKDIDRNVNSKLQEAAEYRKGWEPYEELGVNELDPEGLGALLSFAEALSDESTAREALLQIAEQVGIDLGADAPDVDEADEDPIATVRQELEDLRQWRQAQEERELYATVEAEEAARLEAEWNEVEELNGEPFTEDEKVRLRDLAIRFAADSEQPIKDAYEFISGIAGQAQSALVDEAPEQPTPAEPAGQASTTVEPVESFEEAERLMRERRQMASAN